MRKEEGISLVVIIITIVVTVILAAIIIYASSDSLEKANEAKFKNDLDVMRSYLREYHQRAHIEQITYNPDNLYWNGFSVRSNNTGKLEDSLSEDKASYILGNKIPENFINRVFIENGELGVYLRTNKEFQWANEIGIKWKTYNGVNVLSYAHDTKEINGISITTNPNGKITINGTLTGWEDIFIKISNGIDYASNSNRDEKFNEWFGTDGYFCEKGKKITHKIIIDSGKVIGNTEDACNVAIRDLSNQYFANCKLIPEIYEKIEMTSNKLSFSYIYIRKGTKFENFEFREEVMEDNATIIQKSSIKFIPQTKTFNNGNLTVTLEENGIIVLDGTTSSVNNSFIKLNGMLDIATNGNFTTWQTEGDIIVSKNESVCFSAEELGGSCNAPTGGQVNCVLGRYQSTGVVAYNCKMLELGEKFQGGTALEDIRVVYMFITKDVNFQNYRVQLNLEKYEF